MGQIDAVARTAPGRFVAGFAARPRAGPVAVEKIRLLMAGRPDSGTVKMTGAAFVGGLLAVVAVKAGGADSQAVGWRARRDRLVVVGAVARLAVDAPLPMLGVRVADLGFALHGGGIMTIEADQADHPGAGQRGGIGRRSPVGGRAYL